MGFDWGQVLETDEAEAGEAYDDAVADALYQDRPRQVPTTPPGHPVDQGDDDPDLPFEEV